MVGNPAVPLDDAGKTSVKPLKWDAVALVMETGVGRGVAINLINSTVDAALRSYESNEASADITASVHTLEILHDLVQNDMAWEAVLEKIAEIASLDGGEPVMIELKDNGDGSWVITTKATEHAELVA